MGCLTRVMARMALYCMGWSFKVNKGYRSLGPEGHPRQVVVYPHTSAWELVLSVLFQTAYPDIFSDCVTIAWSGLFKNPIRRLILNIAGCIPVDNNNASNFTRTISDTLNKQERFKFLISPEGSRERRDRLRTGFYHIAKNTNSVYNVVLFDYERHVMHFGDLIHPSNDCETDCAIIEERFSKGVPLYPDQTHFPHAPHIRTTCVDWLTVSNCSGILTTYLFYSYGYRLLTAVAVALTASSFLYHGHKEQCYRTLDYSLALMYFTCLFWYRWYHSEVVWKTFVLTGLLYLVWRQAGHNCRYTNKRYHFWHTLFHFCTIPVAFLEVWLHDV